MRIETSVAIARPPEHVWAFVADPRNDPAWCSKVVSVEQTAGNGPGLGARYVARHRPKPLQRPAELTMDVVEFDPPRRLRWREEDDDGVFDVLYELEPEADGTRLRQIDEIDWKIPRAAQPIARLMVTRHLGQQLRALRELLEDGPPATP
jgi:uncharacterized protein YndB with AHSA1/START domain